MYIYIYICIYIAKAQIPEIPIGCPDRTPRIGKSCIIVVVVVVVVVPAPEITALAQNHTAPGTKCYLVLLLEVGIRGALQILHAGGSAVAGWQHVLSQDLSNQTLSTVENAELVNRHDLDTFSPSAA